MVLVLARLPRLYIRIIVINVLLLTVHYVKLTMYALVVLVLLLWLSKVVHVHVLLGSISKVILVCVLLDKLLVVLDLVFLVLSHNVHHAQAQLHVKLVKQPMFLVKIKHHAYVNKLEH